MNRQITQNRKKGITIVEVVITLVLIAVITASTISVIMMSIEVENNSNTAVEIKTSAENVLKCFRFSETEEEFTQAIQKCGNYNKNADGEFVLVGTNLSVTVKVDFTEKALEYSALDFEGQEIYSFAYPHKDEAEGVDS